MSQNLLLCYGMIKDQLARENRIYCNEQPFSGRVLSPFIREEFLAEVLSAINTTNNRLLHHQQTALHPVARQLVFELTSSIFLRLLEAATGFDNLLPDPYMSEGGFLDEDLYTSTADFPIHKLQKVLRLDLPVSNIEELTFQFSAKDEHSTLDIADCLLSNCQKQNTVLQAQFECLYKNGRFLTLYYYQNTDESQ